MILCDISGRRAPHRGLGRSQDTLLGVRERAILWEGRRTVVHGLEVIDKSEDVPMPHRDPLEDRNLVADHVLAACHKALVDDCSVSTVSKNATRAFPYLWQHSSARCRCEHILSLHYRTQLPMSCLMSMSTLRSSGLAGCAYPSCICRAGSEASGQAAATP